MKDQKLMIYQAVSFHQSCQCQSHRYVPHLHRIVLNTCLAFQIVSSVQLNNDDNDDKKNEFALKIIKMIGKNIKTQHFKSYHIYFREEDCPGYISSLLFCLLELQLSLLLWHHPAFHWHQLKHWLLVHLSQFLHMDMKYNLQLCVKGFDNHNKQARTIAEICYFQLELELV